MTKKKNGEEAGQEVRSRRRSRRCELCWLRSRVGGTRRSWPKKGEDYLSAGEVKSDQKVVWLWWTRKGDAGALPLEDPMGHVRWRGDEAVPSNQFEMRPSTEKHVALWLEIRAHSARGQVLTSSRAPAVGKVGGESGDIARLCPRVSQGRNPEWVAARTHAGGGVLAGKIYQAHQRFQLLTGERPCGQELLGGWEFCRGWPGRPANAPSGGATVCPTTGGGPGVLPATILGWPDGQPEETADHEMDMWSKLVGWRMP